MKKISIIIISLIVFTTISCDVIEPPYTENNNNNNDDTTEKVQRALLEEYTGFRCGFCPPAAELAHDLKDIYGDRLILLTVHAGPLAKPTTKHPYDFRTDEGETLDETFGASSAGNPKFLINRADHDGKFLLSPSASELEPIIQSIIEREPQMLIDIDRTFDLTSGDLEIEINVKYLENFDHGGNLCVYFAEDSVVEYQTDYRLDPPDVDDFVHENVFRGSLNGVWGEVLDPGAVDANSIITKPYSDLLDDEDGEYNFNKFRIICFVYDNDTREILQVAEVPLIDETE